MHRPAVPPRILTKNETDEVQFESVSAFIEATSCQSRGANRLGLRQRCRAMLVFREGDTKTNSGDLSVSTSCLSAGNKLCHLAACHQSGFARVAKVQRSGQIPGARGDGYDRCIDCWRCGDRRDSGD